MKNILIWIEDNPFSMEVANKGILLAKSLGAQISLLYIIEKSISGKEYKAKEAHATALMEGILTKFKCSALIYIEQGNPDIKIMEKARILNTDIIVLGIEVKTGKKTESVGEQIIKHSEIPVLSILFKT
jgi:nucleotide-binding universal stress UspA family protein